MNGGTSAPDKARLKNYRRGHRVEWLAAAFLMSKGYRILARRLKTSAGEIDLIAVRGRRLAFVEVKQRQTMLDCEASITARTSQRVHRAASLWVARKPRFHEHNQGFDLVFITPWAWPVHRRDAL